MQTTRSAPRPRSGAIVRMCEAAATNNETECRLPNATNQADPGYFLRWYSICVTPSHSATAGAESSRESLRVRYLAPPARLRTRLHSCVSNHTEASDDRIKTSYVHTVAYQKSVSKRSLHAVLSRVFSRCAGSSARLASALAAASGTNGNATALAGQGGS